MVAFDDDLESLVKVSRNVREMDAVPSFIVVKGNGNRGFFF